MPILESAAAWSSANPLSAGLLSALVSLAIYIVVSSTPKSRPTLPGPSGWPIVGSLWQRGRDPAETYYRWSKRYGPVFQHRLGNKWCIVINGADAADELLASSKYASAFQSRPVSHSFRELLDHDERTITIGSSPYDDELKLKRRLSIASVGPGVLKNYSHILNRTAHDVVRSFMEIAEATDGKVDPWPVMQRNAMNLAIGIYLGTTPEESQAAFKDVPYPMKRLAQLRNINGHARDYLPILQKLLPGGEMLREAVAVAAFRNATLERLLNQTRERFEAGEAVPCAATMIMQDHKAELTEAALTSVSNSMVSSGLEAHLPNTLLWSVGVLAARPEVQKKCYEAVIRRKTLDETIDPEKDLDDYLMAFVKEVGRVYATFRLSLARETVGRDVVWEGQFIPEGTMVLTNVHAINRDETRYTEPEKFKPERYMSGPEAERSLPHYAFGVGRRNCPAMLLVHKEIYGILSAVLEHFSLSIADGEREFDPVTSAQDGWDFNQVPKQYTLSVAPRDEAALQKYLAEVY